MNSQLLTLYVLFWPLVAAAVLLVLCLGLYRDIKDAKENNDDLV